MATSTDGPKVSVCVITYNHVNYIRQCLQSVLDQKAGFEFEVIVGDDGSTDGTQNVIAEFADRYPGQLIPILHPNNIGGTRNYFSVHGLARGKYIAHLDGDDFALPGKLEKQASILDNEPDTAYVTHECCVVDSSNKVLRDKFYEKAVPALTDIRYLMEKGCFFTHSSKMYRQNHIGTTQSQGEVVDFYFHVEHLRGGFIHSLPEVLGGRREHAEGTTRKRRGLIHSCYMEAFEAMGKLGIDNSLIATSRLQFKYASAIGALKEGDVALFKKEIDLTSRQIYNAKLKHVALFFASRLGVSQLIRWHRFK